MQTCVPCEIYTLNITKKQTIKILLSFILEEFTLANIKSAKKRIKVIAKKTMRNKMIKSGVKTAIKKVLVAAENKNQAEAKAALVNAVRTIDMACSKGVYHKNNASRKKSRLYKLVNKIA